MRERENKDKENYRFCFLFRLGCHYNFIVKEKGLEYFLYFGTYSDYYEYSEFFRILGRENP